MLRCNHSGMSAATSALAGMLGLRAALEYVISHFCTLTSLVTLAGYTFLSQFGLLPASLRLEDILIPFAFTLMLFLQDFSDEVKRGIAAVRTSLEDAGEDKADIRLIASQAELYELMTEKIRTARKSVCIMHLDRLPPSSFNSEARATYFKFIFDFSRRNENVAVRRLASIAGREKGEWVRAKMEETRQQENLSIAYLNTGSPDGEFLRTVASCQLVDDDKVFLLNPISNTVSSGGDFQPCLYIENKKVAELYQKYFDTLWTYAELECDKCRVLKRGSECDFVALERILAELPAPQETGRITVAAESAERGGALKLA